MTPLRVRRMDFQYNEKKYKIDKEHDNEDYKDAKHVLNTLNDAFANGLEVEFMVEFIRNLRQNEKVLGTPLYTPIQAAYHAAMEWDF